MNEGSVPDDDPEKLLAQAGAYDECLQSGQALDSAFEREHREHEELSSVTRLLNDVFAGPNDQRLGPPRDLNRTDLPPAMEHFRFDSTLGRGGFGTVYQAFDELLQRDVAIKVIRVASLSNGGSSERLLEAQAAARLSHKNLFPIR